MHLRIGSFCILLVAGLAWADEPSAPALPKPAAARAKPKPDIVPGYELRTIEGFTLLINRNALAEMAKVAGKYAVEPMDVLESELKALNTILVPKVLKPLQTVRIFVEWDDVPPGITMTEEEKERGGRVVAVYRSGSPLRAAQEGRVHPLKINAVEIMTLKRLTEMHQPGRVKDQIVLLHELCHAIHNVFLGFENRDVRAAYQQAMDRNLYAKAYARSSAPEYFAEISSAYLDQCNFYPHNAGELKEYDPVGYRMMEQVWGKQDVIAKGRERAALDRAARERVRQRLVGGARTPAATVEAKPVESDKVAAAKLDLIKRLIDDGKTTRARERLLDLIKNYPDTPAADEAKKVLDRL